MTTGSAVAVSGKRKNFTEEDDILLLKQVIADEPFRHGDGKVMESGTR
ncbi:hypothetical protein PC129_g17937 [Phytophthora cactorum]|uniref:Uncharacterized protein n=1 Tax=Phytophthora cactorum TaxID=29920 RepID=A0A329RPD6_9STRA|nr:hypothetical protein Pcac1_g17786 [Phytophthora cactorum]KAG2804506.1 hypothetical protein PC112_g18689 [Phytophthora cactorum]KAG2908555.1 hypothetical protein PC115_g13545 [Phytophthora cactorum]KAG3136755.1 hypothetical protein C6341_g21264 [Phytophthora cactorum]KAG3211074.1 hypothetical protein PC129_g17937 [Phytophthora cactorum]